MFKMLHIVRPCAHKRRPHRPNRWLAVSVPPCKKKKKKEKKRINAKNYETNLMAKLNE